MGGPGWTLAQRLNYLEAQLAGGPGGRGVAEPEGWHCNRKNCLYAEKDVANYSTRRRCNGCYTPKYEAMHPRDQDRMSSRHAANSRMLSTSAPAATEKELKKRESRARKRQEKAAKKARTSAAAPNVQVKPPSAPTCTVAARPIPEEAPGPIAVAMAQAAPPQQPVPPTRLQLPIDLVEQIPLLTPNLIKTVTDSLDFETVPAKYEGKRAEELFAKAMGDRGPAAKVAKVADLQATITRLNAVIEASKGGGDLLADVEQSLKAKLEAAETQLLKAQKDAPSQLSELKAVMEAKSSFEVTVQERRDQRRRGADKAAERKAQRHAFIADVRAQLTALEKGLNFLEANNNADHAVRASAITAMDEQVTKLSNCSTTKLPRCRPRALRERRPYQVQPRRAHS